MAYLGVSPSNGVRKVHTYTATASQTTFSGAGAENISLSYRDSTYIDVYQNGVKLADADYTATSGTSVVLGTGASADDMVVVVVYDVFSVADTVSKTDGGQFDGAVTFAGAFTSLGIDDNANATAITIDSSERVGIGLSSPAAPLHVQTSTDGTGLSGDDVYVARFQNQEATSDKSFGVDIQAGSSTTDQALRIKDHDGTNTLMVVDGVGNVGIGTASPDNTLHVHTGSAGSVTANTDSDDLVIENNSHTGISILSPDANRSAIVFGHASDNHEMQIRHDGGTSLSQFISDDAITFNVGDGSERMRIDTSGNVGIGTTSMTTGLELHGATANACTFKLRDTGDYSSGTGPVIAFQGKDSAESFTNFAQISGVSVSSDNGMLKFETRNSGALAERVRIDNGGSFFVGTSSTSPNPGAIITASGSLGLGRNNSNSGNSFIEFRRNATQIGSVTQSGTTGVAFNTSSDYRLKENIVTEWDATTRLKQLKPSRFNFIADKDTTVDGFLAHEVSHDADGNPLVPEAISGEKDGTEKYIDDDGKEQTRPIYQGIDQAKLVPLLTKTLQEALTRIDTLEAEVKTLKGE